MLAGLPARVKGAGDLRAAEGAVVQGAGIFAGERHALGHTLVDDAVADLREAINIGLARAEIPAFDRVVKQTVNAVAVVGIILSRVDPPLGRDAVGPARAVLKTEDLDGIPELGERGAGGGAGEARADDDDPVFALVSRVDQFDVIFMAGPFVFKRPPWNFSVQRFHLLSSIFYL